jgi:hypothetical protein
MVIMSAAIVVPIDISAFQQASAYIIDGGKEFNKLTHDFEKAVIDAAVGNPNETPEPHLIPELLQSYSDSVMRIFLGGPDTIPALLESYEQAVLRVWTAPPEPDKQAQRDQIKEFRQLTHTFVKAVIGASAPPDPE